MTIALLVVGSPAIVTDPNHPARHVTVTRVGRKYVYVGNDLDRGFDRETGRRNDNWGNTRLWTVDEYESWQASELAQQQLQAWGVTLASRVRGRALEIRDALQSLLAAPPSSTEPNK